ncbi:hypothetical protein KAR91_32065, partial [Candidatus Pacearchaeota archaeon]|nr:hypothetical protein [Candidatus Pacearchaeota archaeon]
FSLSKFLPKLPETLSGWFMAMFPYAHLSETAVKQVEKLLGPEGAFSDESFLESGHGCKYLNILAEAHHGATLECIERTIGQWSYERLLGFEQGRQCVVWALEKIAVWPEFFQRAAAVMLKLAEAENASNGNNASGTFAGLFSLAYGKMAPSEAAPEQRMPAITAALESDSAKKRELGLEACKVALEIGNRAKMVGPEYQGLRPVAQLWTPKIYGDLFDAYRRFWDLLLETHEKWRGEERTKAGNVLIDSAGELLWIKSLSDMVLDVLEGLADDPTTDLARLVNFISQRLRYGRDKLDSGVVAKLECLDAKITGDTFNSRIRRFVLLGNWDDLLDEKKGDDAKPENVIAGLAKEARDNPNCLFAIIDTLVKGDGGYVSRFGYELGIADSEKTLLERIVDEYLKLIESATPLLLSGYLCGVYNTDSSAWEEIVLGLLSKPEFRSVIVELIWRSGLTSRLLKELIVSCEKGELQDHELTSLNYSTGIRKMGDEDVISLVEFFIDRGNTTCAWAGLELLNSHYCREVVKQRLPRELTFRTLTSKDLFKGSRQANKDYYWDNVATEFIGQYSSEEMKLLRFLFDAIGDSDWRFYSGHSSISKTITKCVQSNPDGAWDLLTPVIDDVHSIRACNISLWLLPSSFGEDTSGPITLFSRDAILKWVSKSPKDRMFFAAKIAPKTISSDGIYGLAREILDRYGANKDVRSVLWTHFWCGGWCGSQAKYYRKKRDTAREWLEIETSTHVVSWIQEYISILNRFIKESEIEEERRF